MIWPPQTFSVEFGTWSGATSPERERLLFSWRRQQALPPTTTAPWPRPDRAAQWSMSATYTICEIDLRKHTIRLYWKRSDGTPYAYLSALPRSLEGEPGRLLFATNAGMFDPALKPVGLYVEQGRELVHVNTKSGYGNFHMKPNDIPRWGAVGKLSAAPASSRARKCSARACCR